MSSLRPSPHDPQDNARLMMAVMISLAILFGFSFLFEKPRPQPSLQQQAQTEAPEAPALTSEALRSPSEARGASRRIPIAGGKVTGTLSLTGARIDDLTLNEHFVTIEKKEPVPLLIPSGTRDAYYVESGWVSADKAASMPDAATVWELAPGSPARLEDGGAVTLLWDNGAGLLFERRIALEGDYLFKVTQKVTNATGTEMKFNAWHLVSRHSLPPDFKGFFIQHEGPLAYLGGKHLEIAYSDLAKGEGVERDGTKGWLGISDKYWFVGLFAPPQETFNARVLGSRAGERQIYQTDMVAAQVSALPGQSVEDTKFVFAGVKSLPLLTAYEQKYGFPHLDLTIDFGMWYFITKPFFYLLHALIDLFGNVGLAILAITVIIRALVFPLANKSFRSMAGMKKIAPQLKDLQVRYGDNREKLQMEIFELYKRENVNPFSGCWPLLIQIPIFFALYKVILLSVELRHAPFWGWIRDLSAPDPTNIFTLFGLIPWDPPSILHIGAWPVLFCLTMIVQKRLTPPMPDKVQEQLQTWFPYIITFMLANFAAGLVIYWTWSNILGILQQYYILRTVGGEKVSLIRGHHERRKKKPHE